MIHAFGPGESMEGKVIGGKYQLVRLLGVGGMGEVYEAKHVVVGRRFALKFLRPELTANTDIVSRFQREAQAAGALENENIAAVVDTGVSDNGAPFLVMEYLEGEDLAHVLIKHGPLPISRAVFILIQACRGLLAAHEKGIIHRDLKPENLFICKRNDGSDLVKLLDFGIAKLQVGSVMTQTGTTMGTPHYMSLEQARGAKEVDLRTDIYALGVILYEIIGGAKPHPGENYNEILYHVISHEPVSLDSLRPGLPIGLSFVVHKAMAREPGDRYASTADFMAALIPFADRSLTPLKSFSTLAVGVGNTALLPSSLQGITVNPTMGGNLPVPEAPKRWFSPGRVTALFGGVVAISLAAWLAFGRQSKPISIPATSVVSASVPVTPRFIPPVPEAPTPASPPKVEPAPASPPTPGSDDKVVEAPPPRATESRPARRSSRRGATSTGATKTPVVPLPRSAGMESQESPPAPQKKFIRSIDRNNPFAE